ncbi:MAG: anaerobic ribonucleoside-triphosphate reductase activating protein [Deltaproteobacteria bacterium]|nr:anaerobic ribonucleoside-triphosphate reductase activating protein [Deltaproteobacteria bacterium]
MHTIRDLPIKGFIDTSFVDWPGKICAVLFFPLCNFRCPYCHNADLVVRPDQLATIEPESVFARLDDLRGWIDGVCVTGGEPTLQPKLRRLLEVVRAAGFQTKLDTNGSNPDVLRGLLDAGLLDYVAMDVKSCLDESSYCAITSAPESMLGRVRASIDLLREGRVEYEFRITVVPTYHGPEDIFRLARDLSGAARLRLQNFSPGERILDPALNTVRPYTQEALANLQLRVDELLACAGSRTSVPVSAVRQAPPVNPAARPGAS